MGTSTIDRDRALINYQTMQTLLNDNDWLDYYNTNCRSGSSKENCARHVTGSLEKSCVEKEQSPMRRKTNYAKQKALRG